MHPRLEAVRWPVRTERLTIRPATEGDCDAIWEFRGQPSVGEWITCLATDLEDYRERFVTREHLDRTLVVELDGTVIGDLMLLVEDAWSQTEVADQARGVQAELGWTLSPDHEGHGYATEAVDELIRICFEELGLRRLTAECFADNGGSWRLMERLHMRREQHNVADSLHRSGRWLDGYGYALLADEWRARQG